MATIRFNGLENIIRRAGVASDKAAHTVALRVKEDTSPFVPARNGILDRNTKVEKNKIIYDSPYAHYLYVGKLYVDPKTGSPVVSSGQTKVATSRDLVFSQAMHGQAQSHWFEASKAQNLDKWIEAAKKAVKHEL